MSVASAILALNPSSYWKLNESATPSVDEKAVANGTWFSSPVGGETAIVPGDASTSIRFDNADGDRLDFGNVYDFIGTASFTAYCWLKPRAYNSGSGHSIWCNYDGAARGWGLDLVNPAVTFRMARGDNAGFDLITYAMTQLEYENGTPKQIAMVYDGTDLVLNINGVEVKRQASAKVLVAPTVNTGLCFGAYSGGGTGYDGWADELAIFSTALSAAQLLGIYQAAVQTLVPDADTTTTGWTTTPLWSKLDEAVAGGDVVTATAA